jgi:hypothetical protein
MPTTVVNEMLLEPKAAPPAEEGKGGSAGPGGAAPGGPELERQVVKLLSRQRELALRHWTY